jgi:ADP-ribose pyrophosphatase YjhB (NUDIX family)
MATAHLIVSALLHGEGRILLVQERGPGDPHPIWMLPGGRVEHGESVLEALRRELHEETGLELAGEARLAFVTHVIGSGEQYLALTFSCEAIGALAPNDPDGYILDVAWVEESEALARIEGVDWYDSGPLRRHLDTTERVADVAVVDRR